MKIPRFIKSIALQEMQNSLLISQLTADIFSSDGWNQQISFSECNFPNEKYWKVIKDFLSISILCLFLFDSSFSTSMRHISVRMQASKFTFKKIPLKNLNKHNKIDETRTLHCHILEKQIDLVFKIHQKQVNLVYRQHCSDNIFQPTHKINCSKFDQHEAEKSSLQAQ